MEGVDRVPLGRAITAAGIGNFVEWFDYSIYGFLVVVISGVFFPPGDPNAALLSGFAVLAVPVFVRPVGGLFFSHFGDRIGRQRTLATVIILMSLATFSIGLLPGYATLGVLAPVLLVLARAVQGFSAGGEYAGGASFMAEYSPDARRGYLTSWMAVSTGTGLLAGSLVAFLLTSSLSEAAMSSWGWRVPFLLAGPLGIIGFYLRLKLEDTPMFRALEQEEEVAQAPLIESFRVYWRQILLATGIVLGQLVTYYAILVYTPTYLSETLGFESSQALLASTVSVAVYILLLPVFATLSDRFGRRRVMMAGCAGLVLLSYPGFLLISQGNLLVVVLVQAILGGLLLSLYTGPLVAALVELFPTRVRYSGFATSFNVGSMASNSAPFLATYLIGATGSNFIPAYFVIVTCAISLVAAYLIPESAGKPLPQAEMAETHDPSKAGARSS